MDVIKLYIKFNTPEDIFYIYARACIILWEYMASGEHNESKQEIF